MFVHKMSGKKKSTKKTVSPSKKKQKPKLLPKAICDKLGMTCTLFEYSQLKCGGGKKLKDQYSTMNLFFMGKNQHAPVKL